MAWGYRSTADDESETPDYSGTHDFSEDNPDYSNPSGAEMGGGDHDHFNMSWSERNRQGSFGDRVRSGFKDKYNETRSALDAAEKGNLKGTPPPHGKD
jgi:hypothetical protein